MGGTGRIYNLLLLFLLSGMSLLHSGEASIGVNYGDMADNLSPPAEVVKLLKGSSLGRIKLYDADPEMLSALSSSGVEVSIGVTNEEIPRLGSPSLAAAWVAKNVVQHLPNTKIRYICVGNEVLTSTGDQQVASVLVSAMQNLHNALVSYKLDDQVKISAPQSLGILSVSFPPSSGSFKSKVLESSLKSVLEFYSQTRAPFMVNAYPYFAYKNNPSDISLPYALFLPNNGFTDSRTGLIYTNLLSAQVDAVYFAMEKLGYRTIELVVSETGWPSIGDVNEAGASVQNAQNYNKNLITFVNSGAGTPARPRQPLEAYIFSLFNEDLKPGPTSERNFGIFRPDGTLPYDIGLMKTTTVSSSTSTPSSPISASSSSNSSSSNSNSTQSGTPSPPADSGGNGGNGNTGGGGNGNGGGNGGGSGNGGNGGGNGGNGGGNGNGNGGNGGNGGGNGGGMGNGPGPGGPGGPGAPGSPVWCVAKPNADSKALLMALNYACGEGGADCSSIQFGAPCYYPNDLPSHASYAFNSYYVGHGGNKWNCYFGGAAILTLSDPSYGVCIYPSK